MLIAEEKVQNWNDILKITVYGLIGTENPCFITYFPPRAH